VPSCSLGLSGIRRVASSCSWRVSQTSTLWRVSVGRRVARLTARGTRRLALGRVAWVGCWWLLGLARSGEHWGLLTEHHDADLNEAKEITRAVGPLVQIRKIDFPSLVNMLAHFYLHVWCWGDISQGCMVWVSIQEPHGDWDVVGLSFVGHWDGAFDHDQVPLLTIIKGELRLGGC